MAKAGVAKAGWGQGVCTGDIDSDGFVDLDVTYWGADVMCRNRGDGTFIDVTHPASGRAGALAARLSTMAAMARRI